MIDSLQRPDEELFRAFVSGDPQAMAALVTRHAQGVYDFALRSTMDESQASDVTQNAFNRLKAASEIPSQVDFRTWLYSLALVEVLAIANERRPARVAVEDRRFLRSDSDYDAELVLWSWQAARGLRTRDYCVLDLTLRRKMTPEDLADSASLTRSNLYASIGRARGAFEETFGATVLFMRGRQTCPELEAMVSATAGGSVRPALRHQISDHADTCDICRKTMAALPLASEVYVSLMDVDMPTDLQSRLAGAPAAEIEPEAPVVEAAAVGTAAALLSEAEEVPAETIAAVTEAPVEPVVEAEPLAPFAPQPRTRVPSRARATREAPEETFFRPYEDDEPAYVPDYEESPSLAGQWLDSVRRAPVWALGGVMTVVAIYLAIAVGQSIRGGGGDAGAVPLQSTASAGATQTGEIIECGSGPIVLDHGTESVVSFDPRALDGFTIGGLTVTPNSQAASATGLRATAEGTQGIKFQAAKVQSTANRTDQYLLSISWRKGNEIAASQCPVSVRVSAAAP
jgi:DNA-directed RNA polymerase specialized sigma24 family protein